MEYNRNLAGMQPSASIKGGLDSGKALYNLAVGSPDILPPVEINDIINSFAKNPDFRYQTSRGSKLALENVHNVILNAERGIIPTKNIILCSGAKLGIYLALKTITNANDSVMLKQPYWLSYPDICLSLGLNISHFELNIAESDYDAANLKNSLLENKIKVLIINNPNNPAGIVLNKNYIKDMVSFCNSHKIWVILDEVYKDLMFKKDTELHTGLTEFPNLIRIGSFSKSLAMPGMRLGYVTGNEQFIDKYNLFNQHICTSVNSISHFITERISKPVYDNFTFHCAQTYAERYKVVSELLHGKGFEVLESNSSFYILVKVTPKYESVNHCISELLKKGIVVTEGKYYGSQFNNYIRICLTLPVKELEKVFKLF